MFHRSHSKFPTASVDVQWIHIVRSREVLEIQCVSGVVQRGFFTPFLPSQSQDLISLELRFFVNIRNGFKRSSNIKRIQQDDFNRFPIAFLQKDLYTPMALIVINRITTPATKVIYIYIIMKDLYLTQWGKLASYKGFPGQNMANLRNPAKKHTQLLSW